MACEMLGYSREEFMEMSPGDIDSSEMRDKVPDIMKELHEEGDLRFEMVHRTKDGRDVPVEVHSHLFELEEEERVLSVARDITERKRAEERKEFLNSLLKHDAKNKAAVIRGYLDILRDYEMSDRAEEYVEKINENLLDGIQIMERIGTLQEIGEEPIQNIDLRDIIDDVVKEIEGRAEREGMEIEVICPKSICRVRGGQLLKELFTNLILNSIIHSGGNKLRIEGREGPNTVTCTVEDDGSGIPGEVKDEVFERGFKGERSPGSGLGLFLAKTIVESYGGRIEVEGSGLGGAKFSVRLEKAQEEVGD